MATKKRAASSKKKTSKKKVVKKTVGIPKKLLKELDSLGFAYEVVPHKKVFTAYDLAQTLGEQLDKVAKTILLSVDLPRVKKKGKTYVLVVPASYRVDTDKVKKKLKAVRVSFAPEKVMKKFGIEPGTMPPFGSLRDLEVLLDKSLMKSKKVIVRAESLTESLRIRVKDLEKLEDALVGAFGKKAPVKKAKKKTTTKRKTVKKKR